MPVERSPRSGFTLLAAGICAAALFGCAGLAFDIGRIYITKNEAQGYADSAAVAGAQKLDGTAAGLLASDAAVAASVNAWNFATLAFSGTVTEYSANGLTGWAVSGAAVPANMRFVRVSATVDSLPLYLLPVVGAFTSSIGVTTAVKAAAVAGIVIEPPILIPFSPIAHDVVINNGVAGHSDANYGYTVDEQYTLQWPNGAAVGTLGNNNVPCSGDNNISAINQTNGQTSRLGEVAFNGASAYSYQITDDVRPFGFNVWNPVTNTSGDYINPGTGQKTGPLTKAMNDRVAQDSDITSTTGATYHGNGRRLVAVVVQSGFGFASTGLLLDPPTQVNRALGFAQFLLLPGKDPYNSNPNTPFCAIYVGNSPVFGSTKPGFGGNGSGVAFIRLTQ